MTGAGRKKSGDNFTGRADTGRDMFRVNKEENISSHNRIIEY